MTVRQVIAITLAITLGPICIALAFFTALIKGIGAAFWFAWNDACIEVSCIWRDVSGRTIKDFDE